MVSIVVFNDASAVISFYYCIDDIAWIYDTMRSY